MPQLSGCFDDTSMDQVYGKLGIKFSFLGGVFLGSRCQIGSDGCLFMELKQIGFSGRRLWVGKLFEEHFGLVSFCCVVCSLYEDMRIYYICST